MRSPALCRVCGVAPNFICGCRAISSVTLCNFVYAAGLVCRHTGATGQIPLFGLAQPAAEVVESRQRFSGQEHTTVACSPRVALACAVPGLCCLVSAWVNRLGYDLCLALASRASCGSARALPVLAPVPISLPSVPLWNSGRAAEMHSLAAGRHHRGARCRHRSSECCHRLQDDLRWNSVW
jgi:hypothetical protein